LFQDGAKLETRATFVGEILEALGLIAAELLP
jgi:hypothetical protein